MICVLEVFLCGENSQNGLIYPERELASSSHQWVCRRGKVEMYPQYVLLLTHPHGHPLTMLHRQASDVMNFVVFLPLYCCVPLNYL